MRPTYSKAEKLKSKKLIETLFSEGNSVSAYPLRMVYLQTPLEDGTPIKVGVSVSKKRFKNAVDRNRIKRLLREGYRLNKAAFFSELNTSVACMIIYIGKEGTTFDEVNAKSKLLFEKFLKKLAS